MAKTKNAETGAEPTTVETSALRARKAYIKTDFITTAST